MHSSTVWIIISAFVSVSTAPAGVDHAMLTIGPDEMTPVNVVTDIEGNPIVGHDIMNFTNVYTEIWKTNYMRPVTIPGCLCVTRMPLPKFKLIGNIHFKKIKVPPPKYLDSTTTERTTGCPPCECPTCHNLGGPPLVLDTNSL